MERSNFLSTLGSFFSATLLAGALLLGGCDSLTGTTPPEAEEEVTVQNPTADHNTNATEDNGGSTDPTAGHNTTNED